MEIKYKDLVASIIAIIVPMSLVYLEVISRMNQVYCISMFLDIQSANTYSHNTHKHTYTQQIHTGVQRGKKHDWDPIEQFYARAWTYYVNGHPVDKVELLVLGLYFCFF